MLETVLEPAGRDRPADRAVILATGDEMRAIRGECERVDQLRVIGVALQALTRRSTPDSNDSGDIPGRE